MFRRLVSVILPAALLILTLGCAKERPPRSFVQPNVLAKSDFTGLWYYVPTVVDVGYGSSVTFIGETSMDIAIIKWDIQEDTLFARLAYDRIIGAEQGSHQNWEGEIIGAWPISHFDIIRDYNAATGEEINVIRESTERPWYERQFIRVHWESNRTDSWAMFWPHMVSVSSVSYFPTDPNDPDYPKYVRNEDGELVYIGVTTKVVIGPQMRSLDGWDFMGITAIPDCFFFDSTLSCNSTTIKVRHAFWKIDPDHEYAPLEYTQKDMDRFGFFTVQRDTYNRQYGELIQSRKYYASRWNFFGEVFKKATTEAEAEQYAEYDKHEPVDGEYFTCPGGGQPCRYLDDGTKVYITGAKIYHEADIKDSNATNKVYCPMDHDVNYDDYSYRKHPCFYKDDGMEYTEARPVCEAVDAVDGDSSSDCIARQDMEYVQLRYSERPFRPMVYYLNPLFPYDTLWGYIQDAPEKSPQYLDISPAADGDAGNHFIGSVKRLFDSWANMHNEWLDQLKVSRQMQADDGSWVEVNSVLLCPYIPKDYDGPDIYAYGSHGTVKCEKDIRPGDFRHNQVVWVDAPQQYSPLGYGPALPDPLTGEAISAVANIYGAPLDWYAAYARDVVRMLTDENFQWDAFLLGDYQYSWVEMNRLGWKGKSGFERPVKLDWMGRATMTEPVSREALKRMYHNMDFSWAAGGLAPQSHLVLGQGPKALYDSIKARIHALSATGAFGDGTGNYSGYARLEMLRDTVIEDKMMNSNILLAKAPELLAAGYDPATVSSQNLPYGSDIRKQVSPLTWLNLSYVRMMDKLRFQNFRNTVMYLEMIPFEEPASYGVAKALVDSYCENGWNDGANGTKCGQTIYEYLRQHIFWAVTLHEMGHNMGLRHNFKGSYDAMNYLDQYWNIRAADHTVGPRTSDPETQYEIENRIHEYEWTSIMDYGAKFNSDFSGFGKYDKAAIFYTYAGLRQVFNEVNNTNGITLMQNFTEFSYPAAIDWGSLKAVHYTKFYTFADLSDKNRTWVPNAWIAKHPRTEQWATIADLDPEGHSRLMVPYMFCSDEFRQVSLGCNYFDRGADLYEITQNQIQSYENYYIFNNFSRGRLTWGWNTGSYLHRIFGRYFDILQNHVQYYVLWYSIFVDDLKQYFEQLSWLPPGEAGVEAYFTDDENGFGWWTAAVNDIFNTFTRVLTMPQPGCHVKHTSTDGRTYYEFTYDQISQAECAQRQQWGDEVVWVPFIAGKFIDDSWDWDYGYQWYMKMIRRGQFFDRALAIQVLAEASNNFLGRDTQEDLRKYTINFMRVYPSQILDYIGAIQANDWNAIAPRVCQTETLTTDNGDLPVATAIDYVDGADMKRAACADVGGSLQGIISPETTFTIQLYTAAFGMAMFPMNYSQEFVDYSRIYVQGDSAPDFSHLGGDVVTFTDPFSQKVYWSVKYPDRVQGGDSYYVSIGARMIDYANYLRGMWETASNDYQSNPTDENYDHLADVTRELKNYVENLEMFRSLSHIYEFVNW